MSASANLEEPLPSKKKAGRGPPLRFNPVWKPQ